MIRRLSSLAAAVVMTVALSACGGTTHALPWQSMPEVRTPPHLTAQMQLDAILASTRSVCPEGRIRCFASATTIPVQPVRENPATIPGTCTVDENPCLGPFALQTAYGVVAAAHANGANATVGIVDWGAYPTAKTDNAKFRSFFHLPPGNLTIVNQTGGSTLPTTNGDLGEQSLDVAMVSAICPRCKIVLVEADNYAGTDTAEVTALKLADVVTNSFGGPEKQATDPVWDQHAGKVITASAGDAGARGGTQADAVTEPCSYQGVICVGGTRLTMALVNGNPQRASEVVWNDLGTSHCPPGGKCATSSGCSTLVAKPSWQRDSGCTMRSDDDLSMDAVDVLAVTKGQWEIWRGTSASSPMAAAMYALAGQTAKVTAATLYGLGGTNVFNDITRGTNSFQGLTFICPPKIKYLCNAGPGYDGPTGWGTPKGLGAFSTPPPG